MGHVRVWMMVSEESMTTIGGAGHREEPVLPTAPLYPPVWRDQNWGRGGGGGRHAASHQSDATAAIDPGQKPRQRRRSPRALSASSGLPPLWWHPPHVLCHCLSIGAACPQEAETSRTKIKSPLDSGTKPLDLCKTEHTVSCSRCDREVRDASGKSTQHSAWSMAGAQNVTAAINV